MAESAGTAHPPNAIAQKPLADDRDAGADVRAIIETEGRRGVFRSSAIKMAVTACVCAVLLVYVRCGWSYGKDLNPAPKRRDFHNLVSDALVHRQAELQIKPPRGLVELKNPYDPVANAPYRGQGLHDLSLYKGKLYAYFGPGPALLLFIPFRVLRVGDLSPTLAALAFCTAGFAFSLLLFRRLARRFFGELPVWMTCFTVLALGLGIPAPFIIYIGRAYEDSIACGYLLLFAGLYFLLRGLLSETRAGLALLAIGSAALAGAVAARPNLVVAALFVALAVVIVIRRSCDEPHRDRVKHITAIVLPYVVIAVLLALYNFVRFDSFTEFGQRYQLTGTDSTKYAFYQLWYIPHGLYYYLLAPARLSGVYPYAYLLKNIPFVESNDVYTHEPVAGVFTNMPLIGLGLVFSVIQLPRILRDHRDAALAIGSALLAATALVVGASFALRGATMRYTLDFAPLFLIGVLLAWVYWTRRLDVRGARFWLLQTPWFALLAASILFNVAIVLTPCQGTGSC
jgi:hypothetical protein